jgi:hypothetical protein
MMIPYIHFKFLIRGCFKEGGYKMKPLIFLLIIFLLSIMWVPASMYGDIPDREYEALKALYEASGGSHWFNSENWFAGEASPVNTWHGITCNQGNTTVLKIELEDNNLKGTLPPELGDLKNLETLVLKNNRLQGTRKDLGKLLNLTTLDLSNNRLTGSIPSWIGNLKNLSTLDLSNNQLTGGIPSWIGRLKNLRRLDLSYNSLTGGIPSWLGNLKNLEVLLLDGNRLEGHIPAEIGNLSQLKVLKIGHNRLTGKVPSTLSKLVHLADNRSNFKWNGLYVDNDSLRAFLKNKQTGRDWESTQTIAPKAVRGIPLSKDSLRIEWEPAVYKADSGGYQVFYSTIPGGPYKAGPKAGDKTITNKDVTGLKLSTRYYFVVRAWTDAHGSNRNRIESEFSKETSAATRGTTISGTVKTPGGQGVPGVKITASNKGGIAHTGPGGDYHLGVTPGWSGTVTPAKKGFDFFPPSLEYANVDSDRGIQNYTAEANTIISGRIIDSRGNGAAGITLIFSNKEGTPIAEVNTDSKGNYSCAVPYNWEGTVTPRKTFHKFEPPKREYPGVTSAAAGEEYKTFMLPGIGGRVKTRSGKGIPDVILTFFEKEQTPTGSSIPAVALKTGEDGEYSKVFMNDWFGRVTPEKTGYKFYPSNRNYDMTRDTIKKMENYKAELNLKFFISVIGNRMFPLAEDFDNIYGSGLFLPEITAGFKFFRDFYVWGGYGYFSKSGATTPHEYEAKLEQKFLSLGFGYNGNLSIIFGWKAEVGVVHVSFREEMSIKDENSSLEKSFEESSKSLGVKINSAGILKITDRLYTEISIGYLFASDTINEIYIKLGGLRTGIGLGLRF